MDGASRVQVALYITSMVCCAQLCSATQYAWHVLSCAALSDAQQEYAGRGEIQEEDLLADAL